MQENIKKALRQSGLGEKEMQIYLAVLELGKGTITDISSKSNIKRATIYQYIELLTQQGLLIKTVKGKRTFYMAAQPKKIVKILEARKKEIEKFIPQLETIYNITSHKPSIRYYEGINGIREIYQEMTKTSQTVYSAFSADKFYEIFNNKESEKFFQNLKENGGNIKDLIEDTPFGRKHVKSKLYDGFGKAKMLPKEFNLSVDLMVAGNKVAMISLINMVGVIIENPEIAELQRNFLKFIRRD